MFIWRDDEIGNIIASELLRAADRGVRIHITKDRYGISCECSEESRKSFFHTDPTSYERLMISALTLLYNKDLVGKLPPKQENGLRSLMARHRNIEIDAGTYRYDHSKFYIFDRETLVFGGINIEDKENGKDRQGRYYHDYMVEINDKELVERFLAKRTNPTSDMAGPFGINIKKPVRSFEIEQRYLNLINNAQQSLTILMAYFSPEPAFIDAISRAAQRGVKIRIAVPAKANFTDDTNKRTLKILRRTCGVNTELYLSPKMLHAKLLMSESEITVGSSNINKKAFRQLDELNLFTENDNSPFAQSVRESVEAGISESLRVTDTGMLANNPLFALAERILM